MRALPYSSKWRAGLYTEKVWNIFNCVFIRQPPFVLKCLPIAGFFYNPSPRISPPLVTDRSGFVLIQSTNAILEHIFSFLPFNRRDGFLLSKQGSGREGREISNTSIGFLEMLARSGFACVINNGNSVHPSSSSRSSYHCFRK
jgi:hypothetical protein